MSRIKLALWELFHIFFRHYNFPRKLGLIQIGNPDENSPVYLSGNYTLTVHRLLRVLKGHDCYLLVANSRGSNVWCAAGMNEYTEHDIVDAINVAGLSDKVKHRRLIAPPYAAPGVDTSFVKKETGFRIFWGPTHLDDIPRFIKNGLKRTNDMIQVKFGLQDRVEQALATSLAYSLTIAVGLFFAPMYVLGVMAMIFWVYLTAFIFDPIFPEERNRKRTISIFLVLSACLAGLLSYSDATWQEHLLWQGTLLVVVLLMAMDGCGSSALYKTTVRHWLKEGNYESHFVPIVDPNKCTNCMACVLVCPKNVFAQIRSRKKVVSVKPTECIECMACVKQCYDDAIYNRSGEYKGDVKSIPNLHEIMTRDWEYLKDELKWVEAPITIHAGLPVIAEGDAYKPVPSEERA